MTSIAISSRKQQDANHKAGRLLEPLSCPCADEIAQCLLPLIISNFGTRVTAPLSPLRRPMNRICRIFATALLTASIVAIAFAQAPALDVKMGLWEVTSTTNIGGQMPAIDT